MDRYFERGEDPVGRKLKIGTLSTIVGVVGNTRQSGLRESPQPEIYFTVAQIGNPFGQMSLV